MANGTCGHCGAKNVALVGMRNTGSRSNWLANKPACSWCFHTNHGAVLPIEINFEDEEPTKVYDSKTLQKMKGEIK